MEFHKVLGLPSYSLTMFIQNLPCQSCISYNFLAFYSHVDKFYFPAWVHAYQTGSSVCENIGLTVNYIFCMGEKDLRMHNTSRVC